MSPSEDTITFSCTSCGAILTVPAAMAGISGPCPHCWNQITSPAAPVAPTQAAQASPPFPRAGEPAFPIPAPEPSSVPLWQRLPQASVEQIPSPPESRTTQPAAASAPQAITPEAGLSPGNFTRNTPSVEQEPALGRKQRRKSSRGDRRWGVLVGSLFFIGLALAGAGWFFQDQVKIYWSLALARFQKIYTPDTEGVDPEVSALLKSVRVATGPGQGGGMQPAAPKESKGPAAVTKPPGKDSIPPREPVKTQPQTVAGNKPIQAAPAERDRETKTVIAGAVPRSIPPPASSPVEAAKAAAVAAPTPGEPPKTADRPAPEVLSDPPARKALPVDSDEIPMKSPKRDLPESLSPMPPGPQSPAAPALVEVPPPGKGATAADDSAEKKSVFIKAAGDAKPAADTLSQFFQASTWQERLLFTQPQEKVRPLMERYYADNADGPLRVSSIELIRHEKTPEIGTPLCVFQVSGPDLPEPLPVMVESTSEGWKVDWLTLMEFKDKLLLRFLQKWQDDPARFHVMVRRTHYFDEDVPGLDKKHCFELMPPTPGYSGFAFVPKGSPLAQNLERSIGWEVANIAAVVELRWRKQDRYQWVEITAVPQFNWRSTLPAIPVARSAEPASGSESEALLAKPAPSGKPPAVAEKK